MCSVIHRSSIHLPQVCSVIDRHAGHYIMQQTPHGRGFETSLGFFEGMEDHWNQRYAECNHSTDLWDTDKPAFGMNGSYGDYLYSRRAVSVIEAHPAATPLFYFLSMQCAHYPMQVPDRFADLLDNRTCPDVIEYAFSSVIDEVVHNVTEALKQKGMWPNTLSESDGLSPLPLPHSPAPLAASWCDPDSAHVLACSGLQFGQWGPSLLQPDGRKQLPIERR